MERQVSLLLEAKATVISYQPQFPWIGNAALWWGGGHNQAYVTTFSSGLQMLALNSE